MVELFEKAKWMEKYKKKEIIHMMKKHVNPEWRCGNRTQTLVNYETISHSNPKVVYNRQHRISHEREGTNMSKYPAVIDDIKYSWRELKAMKKEMLIFLAFRLGIEEEE